MGGRVRWRPGTADVVFVVVLAASFLGGRTGFLNDPGTFWHLRLGRDILRDGAVPRVDTLTRTRAGTAWVDQSWAFDAGLALVVDRFGWPGAVALTALALALIYASLAAALRRDGTSPLVAAAVSILAAGIGTIHFLVRPHLVTFAAVLATQRLCRSFHLRGGRSIWLVPLVLVVWANCHGGFLAGPVIVGTAAVGQVLCGTRDLEGLRRTRILLTVFLIGLFAPLLNPYGPDLYAHVTHVLYGSRVTDLIDEYQPSPFGKGQARVLEWVVLALVALPVVSSRRPRGYDLIQTLIWLHLALVSIRHAPLFAFAVAPALAALLDGLLTPGEESAPARGFPAWPAVAAIVFLVLVGRGGFRCGPDPRAWPLGALATLDRQPVSAPLFHEQDWGGLIESECRPRRAAYLDDRFELWGRPPLLE